MNPFNSPARSNRFFARKTVNRCGLSVTDRPSVELVEAVHAKLKDAAFREDDGLALVVLKSPEVDALRYLCSLYPLAEDLRARALRRARSRSQRSHQR